MQCYSATDNTAQATACIYVPVEKGHPVEIFVQVERALSEMAWSCLNFVPVISLHMHKTILP